MALDAAVAALFVYPVKSCGGVEVASARMTERGLERDREWMIVGADDRFLSQREVPRLALVRTALLPRALELAAAGHGVVQVPYGLSGPRRTVTVWRDTLPAIDQGDDVAAWLSEFLDRAVRLVCFDAQVRRACNRAYVGDSGAHTGFADAYPLLVLSSASLADLNGRLAQSLPVDRFRPNVLLSGLAAYDEDHIEEIAVGAVRMKLVKPCTRCQITTTDQRTGERGPEPLATLATYRMNAALEGVAFGVNAMPTAGLGAAIATGAAASCTLRF